MNQLSEVTKIFVFEKQSTSQSEIVNCRIRTDYKTADLLQAIEKIADPAGHTFKIYDNDNCKFIKLKDIVEGENFRISYHYIQLEHTIFRYAKKNHKPKQSKNNKTTNQQVASVFNQSSNKNVYPSSQSSISSSSLVLSDSKKQRSKERSIGQVVELVKRWRNIHLGNENEGKVSLQEAAKIVGISKKTLDDYYYQLRIGQLKKFDFNEHLFQKIGVLRNFIKGHRGVTNPHKTYSKHPKKLKVIQQNQVQSNSYDAQHNLNDQGGNKNSQMQIEDLLDFSSNENTLKDYQNNFFGQFQFLIQEPNDPFFNFQKSFHKKKDFFKEDDAFFD